MRLTFSRPAEIPPRHFHTTTFSWPDVTSPVGLSVGASAPPAACRRPPACLFSSTDWPTSRNSIVHLRASGRPGSPVFVPAIAGADKQLARRHEGLRVSSAGRLTTGERATTRLKRRDSMTRRINS